ncbi:MAG: DUF2800 domain-containing protein [Acidiferrobacterales bacterium]|nr:DUF2800 domain-containing protein [Acidiferrobacterales bacterium]
MGIAHAKLSASGSHRWLNCPGSVQAEQGKPDSRSTFAEEGTAAHELAELVLTQGGSAFDWEGYQLPENNAFTVTRDMAGNVQEYVDYVKGLGGVQMYEERVDFSPWVPEGFGTSDAICIVGDTLHAVDLKYGKGLRVDAEQNTQGLLYALGAVNEYGAFYEFERVVIAIVQPRLDHISEWEISRSDLMRWADWIKERADLAASGKGERVPGEKQCRWCKAKATCDALEKYTHDIIATDFEHLDDMQSPDAIEAERLSRIIAAKPLIVSWLDAVEAHARDMLESGESVPGYKLVEGRSIRQWSDAEQAERTLVELLGDEAHERKLLSVAKAEKALGKKRAEEIAELVVKPAGKPTMVPESDKRQPIGTTSSDFDEFDA